MQICYTFFAMKRTWAFKRGRFGSESQFSNPLFVRIYGLYEFDSGSAKQRWQYLLHSAVVT